MYKDKCFAYYYSANKGLEVTNSKKVELYYFIPNTKSLGILWFLSLF